MPTLVTLGMVAALALATTAVAGDALVTCEASKLGTSAKYAQCRLKAESKAVKTGDAVDYSKCSLAKFTDAESKAADAGGTCPTTGDLSTVTTFLNDCTARVATSLGGGGGIPDTCPTDLATCAGNLTTCDGDLTTCDGDLAACAAEADGQVPKTGQTTCYDTDGSVIPCAGTAHDGETQHGIARSYTDNGDGTVTDNNTGLMWEKLDDSNLGGVAGIHDRENLYTWANAFVKANDLNAINFAGHNDWRVPSVMEQQSIVNFGALGPSVNTAFNSACAPGCTVTTCSCTRADFYWSSTTYQPGTFNAWIVSFFDGITYEDDKTNSYYVRAVRAGSA
jgi:hypothetical protein